MNAAPATAFSTAVIPVNTALLGSVDCSLTQLVQPRLTTKQARAPPSGHACSLVEEHGLDIWILHVDALAQFHPKLHAALDGRARFYGFKPPFQVRELLNVLALSLPKIGPTYACHVGD